VNQVFGAQEIRDVGRDVRKEKRKNIGRNLIGRGPQRMQSYRRSEL